MLWIILIGVLVAFLMFVAVLRFGERRVRAITWKKGERWIRFTPNPGFKFTEKVIWSRARGRARR